MSNKIIGKIRGYLQRSDFVKNSLLLTIGTSIAQFFPLIIYPILGRVYTPSQFGFLASVTAITSILSVFSTGKYEMSVLIADTDTDAANVSVFSLFLSIILLVISSIVFFVIVICGGSILNSDSQFLWLVLSSLSAFCINVFNCYNEWCIRKKYYKKLSINKITNSISVSSGKLLFGFVKISNEGLVIGDTLGRVVTATACFIRVLKKDYEIFKNVTLKGMKEQALRFKKFPLYTMPAQLLNTLGASIPILLLGHFYNQEELGYFSMAQSVIALPISVISLSIRDVFRQKANVEYKTYGSCRRIFVKIFKYVTVISIIGGVCAYFVLPKLFEIFIGPNWITAGYYSRILLPMIVVDFISMSLSGVLIITEKLKQSLIWQIYYCISSCIAILIGGCCFENIESTIAILMIARLSAYVYQLIINYHYSESNEKN